MLSISLLCFTVWYRTNSLSRLYSFSSVFLFFCSYITMRLSSSYASIAALASLAGIVVAAPSPLAAATDNTPSTIPPTAPALPAAPDVLSILGSAPSPLGRRAPSSSEPLESRQLGDLLSALNSLAGPIVDQVLTLLGLKAAGPSASGANVQSLASQLTPDQVSHITALVKNMTGGDSGPLAPLSGATSSLPVVGSVLPREEQH
ncbi:hypothetical protein BDY19DRAFT_107828 [Irpex rosettiformis]|uniref:Uncharacterized protein n=1 Tax=Irpex rosettiformis TaxID=378272 RepID=A0ACB8U5T6_9APHY|nr:hypothetical protein BDY19DRAFT_107828 [Irpex rosettiformis]